MTFHTFLETIPNRSKEQRHRPRWLWDAVEKLLPWLFSLCDCLKFHRKHRGTTAVVCSGQFWFWLPKPFCMHNKQVRRLLYCGMLLSKCAGQVMICVFYDYSNHIAVVRHFAEKHLFADDIVVLMWTIYIFSLWTRNVIWFMWWYAFLWLFQSYCSGFTTLLRPTDLSDEYCSLPASNCAALRIHVVLQFVV